MADTAPDSIAQRRRAVAFALSLSAGTALAPGSYERQLLARYEQGEFDIGHVVDLFDAAPYQLIYRSEATTFPRPADLQRLLDQARVHNAGARLTGLLLYRDGRYLQVLEGPPDAVLDLYACIRCDPRHARVVTISEGLVPARFFSTWHMAFGNTIQPAVARLLDAALAQEPASALFRVGPQLSHLVAAVGAGPENALVEAA